MQSELSRAKRDVLMFCPSAAHVILKELQKRVEVVRCFECEHAEVPHIEDDACLCWKNGRMKSRYGYCDEGERKSEHNQMQNMRQGE